MQKLIKALVILLLIAAPYSHHAKAETIVSVNELIEHAKEYDGKEVLVQGEAIGENLERGDYSWINMNDGTNAIGLWVSKSEADKVTRYGDYKNIGDTLQITATFYRACREHGGEADLHVNSIKIVEQGYTVHEQAPVVKIVFAGISMLIAIVMFLWLIIKMKDKQVNSEKFVDSHY